MINLVESPYPLEELLLQLEQLPRETAEPEPNFFTVGGRGYLENPTSDLLALFMGGERGVPPWLARALVACLATRHRHGTQLLAGTDWSAITARREVAQWDGKSESSKRLDLVIGDGNFVLGVEHKIYASASHNPFHVYDQLLKQEARGGPVLKCVLRVKGDSSHVPADWPVISYDELVDTALAQYGADVAIGPVSKWQVFYREFLLHLRELANPRLAETMNVQSLDFACDNYTRLLDAAKMLRDMEAALQHEGLMVLAHRFASKETALTPRVSTWPDNVKALRYFPAAWGGESQIVLVYYPGTSEGQGAAVRYRLHAYIDRSSITKDIAEIRREFLVDTGEGDRSWNFRSDQKDDERTWSESNGRLLALRVWARKDTKDGVMEALGDLAMWIHDHVYSSGKEESGISNQGT
jgi:hypothetical protein